MLPFKLLLFCFPGGRRKKKKSFNWDFSGGGAYLFVFSGEIDFIQHISFYSWRNKFRACAEPGKRKRWDGVGSQFASCLHAWNISLRQNFLNGVDFSVPKYWSFQLTGGRTRPERASSGLLHVSQVTSKYSPFVCIARCDIFRGTKKYCFRA